LNVAVPTRVVPHAFIMLVFLGEENGAFCVISYGVTIGLLNKSFWDARHNLPLYKETIELNLANTAT